MEPAGVVGVVVVPDVPVEVPDVVVVPDDVVVPDVLVVEVEGLLGEDGLPGIPPAAATVAVAVESEPAEELPPPPQPTSASENSEQMVNVRFILRLLMSEVVKPAGAARMVELA